MKPEIKKEERRKFMGGVVTACVGAAACLGLSKKAQAADCKMPHGTETLYRKTPHVDEYLRTLED